MLKTMGSIYLITNTVNDKKYVGQTIHPIEKRFEEHKRCAVSKGSNSGCIALYSAMDLYGVDKFKTEILDTANTDEELDELEIKHIAELNTLSPNGYNIRTGGKNGKHCDESRERMRLAKLGDKNHNFGKPRTEETKRKISESRAGEKHHFYGKELTDEHKLKLSQAHKKYDSSLPMYIAHVKAQPEKYKSEGYAVTHPKIHKTSFTSKYMTLEQKLTMAKEYLSKELEKHRMDAVQRLNGSGLADMLPVSP